MLVLTNAPVVARQCSRCESLFRPREQVLARVGRRAGGGAPTELYHPLCAVDVDLEGSMQALARTREYVMRREELERAIAERLRALDAIASRARAARKGAAADLEPSRDALGRPRVRVAVTGSAATAGWQLSELFDAIAPTWAWASPLREYQFVAHTAQDCEPPDERTHPLIASVFAVLTGVAMLASERALLLSHQARGLPTPVLLLLTRRRRSTRPLATSVVDNEVRRYRKVIDDCGFAGDESLVVLAQPTARATLDALVAALDEAVPAVGAGEQTDRSPIERACEQAHTLIDLERDVGLRQALERVVPLVNTADARERSLLVSLVVRAAGLRVGFSGALGILRLLPDDALRVACPALIDQWRAESELPSGGIEEALGLLMKRAPEALLAALDALGERAIDEDYLPVFAQTRARLRTRVERRTRSARQTPTR